MPRPTRDESLSDRLLRLAPHLPPMVRLWAARRAAARGLATSALRAAPDDPVVLARLGLHVSALQGSGAGRSGAIARSAAAAALGDITRARRLFDDAGRPSDGQRRLVAAWAAAADPRWALTVLPSADQADRAACALASGRLDLAEALLSRARSSQQTRYLAGAVAARKGDWVKARAALNRAFVADGLCAPLDEQVAGPTCLEAFGGGGAPANDGPLISVIMPARDSAATVAVAAQSVLAQTWRNLELLIIDDDSADQTAAIVTRLAERDPRVRLLANQRARGAYGARNTAIEAARGRFVALHDADDWAHPQRLERQMGALAGRGGLTLCRHLRVDGQGLPLCPRVFPFVRLSPITALTRTEAWSAIGLFEETDVGADSEWLARFDDRFGRRAAPRTTAAAVVALWRPGSLSSSATTGLVGAGASRRVAYVETWRRRHAAAAEAPIPAWNLPRSGPVVSLVHGARDPRRGERARSRGEQSA